MRKFSKILALLLSVLMLAGTVLAINVSADSDVKSQLALDIEGVRPGMHGTTPLSSDFEDGKGLYCWTTTSSYYGTGSYSKEGKFGESSNTFLKFYSDGKGKTSTLTSKLLAYQRFGNGKTADRGLMFDDFIVHDWEIATDSFVINNELVVATDVDADANGFAVWTDGNKQGQTAGSFVMVNDAQVLYKDLKLAYLNGYNVSNVATTFDQTGTSTSAYYIGKGGSFAYDEASNTWTFAWGGKDYKLPTTPGVFTHFTMIIKMDNSVNYTVQGEDAPRTNQKFDSEICYALLDNPGASYTKDGVTYTDFTLNVTNSKVYYYVNGEYHTDYDAFTSTLYNTTNKGKLFYQKYTPSTGVGQTKLPADAYQIEHQYTTGVNYQDSRFSMCYDNIAVNYYEDGYTGMLANYDLKQPLYYLDDVVYKASYENVNEEYKLNTASVWNAQDQRFEVMTQTVNEAQVPASFTVAKQAVDYALNNLNSNAVAVISNDVTNYTLPAGIAPDSFRVKLENGAKFTLAEGVEYVAEEKLDEQGCTVFKSTSEQEVEVFWYPSLDEAVNDQNILCDAILTPGDAWVCPDTSNLVQVVHLGNGVTKTLSGWQYIYYEGDNEPKNFEGDEITVEMFEAIEALKAQGEEGACLLVFPTYETVENYFSVTKDGTTTWYAQASDFNTALDGATGVNDVVLYKNVILDAESSKCNVLPGTNFTLNLDLNGKTLAMKGDSNANCLFRIATGINYNIYSTAPGAVLATKLSRLFNSTHGTNDTLNVTINIGTIDGIEGANGANLKVSVGWFMFSAPSDMTANNKLNVKDTTIFVTQRFVGVRDDWTVVVDNSDIIACDSQTGSAYSLFLAQGTAYAKLDIIFKNDSTILSGSKGSVAFPLFEVPSSNSSINFTATDTVIACNKAWINETVANANVKLNLGENVRILTPQNVAGDVTVADGFKLVPVKFEENGIRFDVPVYNNGSSVTNAGVGIPAQKFEFVVAPVDYELNNTALEGILVNITTNNGFWVNFYVPTSLGVTVDQDLASTTTIAGVEYNVYTIKAISPNDLYPATIRVEMGEIDGVKYYKQVAVSLLDYFNGIINKEGATDTEKALVVNAANYCNTLYTMVTGVENAGYKAIVSENEALLVKLPTFEDTKEVVSDAVVGGANLVISANGYSPALAFLQASEAKVTVKYTDINGVEQEVTCETITENKKIYYYVKEMKVYDMIGTIEVYADGVLAVKYSLGDYINANAPKEGEAQSNSYKVGVALYKYAKAVENFKKS